MKKILTALSVFMAVASMATAATLKKASPGSYTGYLVNETGLAYSANYDLDTAEYDGNSVAAIVNYGTATFSSATFTDGSQSTGSITVVSTTALTGESVTIGGITLTVGTDFPLGATTATTAANLAQVINASTCPLSSIISAEAISNVVYATSTYVGGNYAMSSSSNALLTLSGANMTGGSGAYFDSDDDTIQIADHGFTLGLPVLYTEGATLDDLVDQTTYYVIPVDSDHIQLATTSAYAVAGTEVNIATQAAHFGANTFTLAPLDMGAYNASAVWQYSNDGTNFISVPSVDSIFVSSASASTYAGWDFSDVNYRYLRLSVTGPTNGGIVLNAVVDVKK